MSVIEINSHIQIPLKELNFSFSRSRGPGGQHVNKVNSKATLQWDVKNSEALPPAVKRRFFQQWSARVNKEGVLVIQSDENRDQRSNVDACTEKLKQMVTAAARRPKTRIPTRPSRSSVLKNQESKRRHSERKSTRSKSKNIRRPDD